MSFRFSRVRGYNRQFTVKYSFPLFLWSRSTELKCFKSWPKFFLSLVSPSKHPSFTLILAKIASQYSIRSHYATWRRCISLTSVFEQASVYKLNDSSPHFVNNATAHLTPVWRRTETASVGRQTRRPSLDVVYHAGTDSQAEDSLHYWPATYFNLISPTLRHLLSFILVSATGDVCNNITYRHSHKTVCLTKSCKPSAVMVLF
jgi:hypothetical protein